MHIIPAISRLRFISFMFFSIIILLCLPGSVQPKPRTTSAEAQVHKISGQENIKIDGLLTESVWQNASPIGSLTMVEPDEGVPPSMPTEVRVVVDSQSIYFGIMCFDRGRAHASRSFVNAMSRWKPVVSRNNSRGCR